MNRLKSGVYHLLRGVVEIIPFTGFTLRFFDICFTYSGRQNQRLEQLDKFIASLGCTFVTGNLVGVAKIVYGVAKALFGLIYGGIFKDWSYLKSAKKYICIGILDALSLTGLRFLYFLIKEVKKERVLQEVRLALPALMQTVRDSLLPAHQEQLKEQEESLFAYSSLTRMFIYGLITQEKEKCSPLLNWVFTEAASSSDQQRINQLAANQPSVNPLQERIDKLRKDFNQLSPTDKELVKNNLVKEEDDSFSNTSGVSAHNLWKNLNGIQKDMIRDIGPKLTTLLHPPPSMENMARAIVS